MQGISWLAEELVASEEGFCAMELVIYIGLFHGFLLKYDVSEDDSVPVVRLESKDAITSLPDGGNRPSFRDVFNKGEAMDTYRAMSVVRE
jgi:hypothetical protein